MDTHYRHTQIGWVILGVLAAMAALVAPRLPPGGTGVPGAPLLVVLGLVAVLFSTLTVEVDREAIRLRFGIGVIRKRLSLDEVRAWQAVRNPWYCGWGIRLGSHGVTWNVSGYDAVELVLADGRRFRIGTDEPDALASAITRVRGEAGVTSAPDDGTLPPAPRGPRAWGPLLVIGLILVIGLGGLFWFQMRPVTTTVSAEGLIVGTPFYGTTIPLDDISSISLVVSIPRVLARTNGFSAAGVLRGHFAVEGLGHGRLFVELGSAPYVFVRLSEGFVFVNFPDPEDTRAFYEELARALPDRVESPAP